MGGTHPLATLRSPPTVAATRRAERAVIALTEGRKFQWHLQVLGSLWFSMASCFRLPGRAVPSLPGLQVVARLVDHSDLDVAIAAVQALCAAAEACSSGTGAPVASWADVPDCVAGIRRSLGDGRALLRLAASRLLAGWPTSALAAETRVLLDDPVYSVRWNAIVALATLGSGEGLREALERSAPRASDGSDWYRYADAVAAVDRVERRTSVAARQGP